MLLTPAGLLSLLENAQRDFSIYVTHVAPHASIDTCPANDTHQAGMRWDEVETGVASCAWLCHLAEISEPKYNLDWENLMCKMRELGSQHHPTCRHSILSLPRTWPRRIQSG